MMQRPVMNPMFMDDSVPDDPAPRRRAWRRLVRIVGLAFSFVARVLLYRISLRPRGRGGFRVEDGTPMQRLMRAILYRLAFLPVVLVLFIVSLVFAVTHPPHVTPDNDPLTQGVYYDPINFLSEDNTRLEGWLVPVYEAKRVLSERDKALTKKHPAVILLHDFDGSRQQVLSLVQPLHDAGFVVLVLGLRGSGPGLAGHTFGLNEAKDVRAAVQMLRRRAYVDPMKISLFGLGTGANAALLAAETDPAIAALVLDRPIDGFEPAFGERVGEPYQYLTRLAPLFEWTFEMMYHVDADQLAVDARDNLLTSRPVLLFNGQRGPGLMQPQNLQGVQEFLTHHTAQPSSAVATASVDAMVDPK